jgi:hypothetical protein
MRLLGIDLRKPSFAECTSAAVFAVGCWLLLAGLARAGGVVLTAAEAGGLLVVVAWGAFATRIGVGLDQGGRHAAVHLAVCATLLAGYQTVVPLA